MLPQPLYHSPMPNLFAGIRAGLAVLVFSLLALGFTQSAQGVTMSVGNCVFFDANSNGHYDAGEGVGGVQLELWHATGDPFNPYELVGSLQTQPSGYYLFQGLVSGSYYVRIPDTEFALGKPLAGTFSIPGAQLTGDDDTGEDGQDTFDASVTGINSTEFSVYPGFGPTASTGEVGFQSSTDDAEDANVDLTIDFGFYKPVGIGNLVFADMNGNGHADPGEGIPGVTVQLFKGSDDTATAVPLADVVTSSSGTFMFGGLAPGSYKLHVPASQFAPGGPLAGATSVVGVGAAGADDDVANSDDGVDSATPATTGITSVVVALAPGTAPTASTGETGTFASDDDWADADNDLTIDLGFVFPANKMSVGNLVFIDYNHVGHYEDGDGVPGVNVQLFLQGQNPLTDTPIATRVTNGDGSYLFTNLDPGSYILYIPKSEFAPGKPLFSALSITGASLGDDDTGEDGLDVPYPEGTGVKTAIFSLVLNNAPTDATSETGYGSDSDNFRDSNVDLTHDFGFVQRANSPLSVGNLVFNDTNHNGSFDSGEQGIGAVLLKLFHEGDDPLTATPVATQSTASNGSYMFTGLTPGRYFVFVPPSEFGSGKPLVNLLSSPGNGGDDGADDNVGENGIDSATPASTGIRSIVFELTDNQEPSETGFSPNMDSDDDNNGDLTIDFGFGMDCPALTINPANLPDPLRDQGYSNTLTLSGGTGTITWSISSGSLPFGLTLNSSGLLSGIPLQAGSSTFTVKAETPTHCIVSKTYTLVVQAPYIMGVGNVIFADANGNGRFDAGEGVSGVQVQLFRQGDNPATATPLAQTTSVVLGAYAFNNLQAGNYFVHIPASQFASGAPLYQKISVPGDGRDNDVDDNFGENGMDAPNPSVTGISSNNFTLTENGEPTDATTEKGFDAAADNADDANFNATIDFGFIPDPSVSVGIGNLVFRDANNSGHFEEGEGVDGVTVQLFLGSDNPLLATPQRTTVTVNGGRYGFMGLQPGTYKVFIPPTQFVASAPLYGTISMTGNGAVNAGDDNVDEDGIDDSQPSLHGISSSPVILALGTQPQNSDVELGASHTSDDAADANTNLTVDFGFVRDCHGLSLLPGSLPDGVFGINYSAQMQTTGGVSPYVYSLASGTLPPGLTLSSAGLLGGSPTSYGSWSFAVQSTDAFGCFVIVNYTVAIAAPPLAVGNLIFFDKNGDGHASAGEGVDGVTVQIFTSTQTPGVDAPLAQTTTAGGGFWLVDNLNPGSYVVHVPAAMFATGSPLWKMKSVPGVLGFGDDDTFEDGSDSLDPATTGVTSLPFALQPGACPTGAQESGLAGSSDDARDANIDLTRDLGFVDATTIPATFAAWQAANNVTGPPTGNSDNDALSNLMEYAFGENPASGGTSANTGLSLIKTPVTGAMTVQLRRRHGGTGDLAFAVQVLANLAQSPASWAGTSIAPTIVNNGDGTETLTFANVDTDPAFTGSSSGFVRVQVSLDADHNGTPEAVEASSVLGWQKRSLAVQHQTYSLPFVAPVVFTGTVDSVTGNDINVATSAGSVSISSLFASGYEYYIEVISGDNEGHRFDVDEAASTAFNISLLPANLRSTKNAVPANLAGDLIALRPYWRMADLFPTAEYHATTSVSTADQIILWDSVNSSYVTMWLVNAPTGKKWLRVGDATLASQNNLSINPSDGLFNRPRVGAVSAFAAGQVRSWKFATPIKPGLNFVGNPYAVAQSPADRLMSVAGGFTGASTASAADKFNFWNGDATTNTTYSVYYLLKSGGTERWLLVGDATLTNRANEKLFPMGTGVFVNSKIGQANWVLPVPWTP